MGLSASPKSGENATGDKRDHSEKKHRVRIIQVMAVLSAMRTPPLFPERKLLIVVRIRYQEPNRAQRFAYLLRRRDISFMELQDASLFDTTRKPINPPH